jgi:predicted nucleic acid-binding protein
VIYLDSNVFVYANLHTGREGDWCRALLRQVAEGREQGVTAALTLDEVVYKVRENRGLEASLEAGRAMLEMANLAIAPTDADVLWRSLDLADRFRLYPRDAIHAATAGLRDVSEFCSEDDDFDAVEGLRRRWMR